MAEDDVTLRFEANDDVSAALRRIEDRLEAIERQEAATGAAGRRMGDDIGAGADKASDSTRKMGDSSDEAAPKVKRVGDEASKTGAKIKKMNDETESMSSSLGKAAKKLGSFGPAMSMLKFGVFMQGGIAAVGVINALAGSVLMAAGNIGGPMVGALAAVLPLFVAGKLAMLGWKLAADELKPEIEGLKQTFAGVGPAFANAGLKQALADAKTELVPLAKVAEGGFAGLGVEAGAVARNAMDVAKSGPMLKLVSDIFAGLRPILRSLGDAGIALASGLLFLFRATLPIGQDAADMLRSGADAFADWAAGVSNSGKATEWLTAKWNSFKYAVGVAWDFLQGLFNILRIGAGITTGFGKSLHDAAAGFEQWTKSPEGVAEITRYFQQGIPVLRELGLLVRDIVKGFLKMGTDGSIAPLIAQIRTELLPALFELLAKFSGDGGLLSSLVSIATGVLKILAAVDFTPLTLLAGAVAAVANAVVWLTDHVPGFSTFLGILLSTVVIGGLLFSVAAKLVSAFTFVSGAWTGANAAGKALTSGQTVLRWVMLQAGLAGQVAAGWIRSAWGGLSKVLAPVGTMFRTIGGYAMTGFRAIGSGASWLVGTVRGAATGIMTAMRAAGGFGPFLLNIFRTVGMGIIGVIRAIGVAMMSNPIIAAIMIIIGILLLLWFKCDWFRNGVIAIFKAIGEFFVMVWRGIVVAFNAVVDAIVAVAKWLWENGIKPYFQFIAAYWRVIWNIVKFVVQVVVFIIVAIITLIAIVAKWVWDRIVEGAQWLGSVLGAIWAAIVAYATVAWRNLVAVVAYVWANILAYWYTFVGILNAIWQLIVAGATIAWNWLYDNIIKPVVDRVVAIWNGFVAIIGFIWSLIVAGATIAWNFLYANVIAPVVALVMAVWNPVVAFFTMIWNAILAAVQFVIGGIQGAWNGLVGFLMPIFSAIGNAGRAVWDGIVAAATNVGNVVRGVFNAVVGAVKGAYNVIANGWNSIPSITVPDWVPGLGGQGFSLPKLPVLEHGGRINYSSALVGEVGPEALVRNGRVEQMLGMSGPEIRTDLPRGGFVVPALETLAKMPGLTKSIPSSVASAVSRSVPGYGDLLGRTPTVDATVDAPSAPAVHIAAPETGETAENRRHREMMRKLDRLIAAGEREQPAPPAPPGGPRRPARPSSDQSWARARERFSYA